MANTIIQIKNSGVTGNVPVILQPGELAINYFDGKLFYGNSLSQPVLFDTITEPSGLNGEIQFNNMGTFGADNGLTFNNTTKTLNVSNLSVTGAISGDITIKGNVTTNIGELTVIGNYADPSSILRVKHGLIGDIFRVAPSPFGGMSLETVDYTSNNYTPLNFTGNVIHFNTLQLSDGQRIRVMNMNDDGTVRFVSNLHSSNTTSGAIIVNGGIGVSDNIHSEMLYANGVFDSTIRILDVANDAYEQANTGTILAQAAFDKANTTDSSSYTITGAQYIDYGYIGQTPAPVLFDYGTI